MNRIKILGLGLIAASLLSLNAAYAEEDANKSTAKLPTSDAPEGDIDTEIRNNRLRAILGAKSRWSSSISTTYNGGSIQSPLNEKRPRLQNGDLNLNDVSLSVEARGRYRINKNTSLSAGIGLNQRQPFHSSIESSENAGDNFSLNNPFIAAEAGFKAGIFQNRATLTYTHGTSDQFENDQIFGRVSGTYSFMHLFKEVPLTLGMATSVTHNLLEGDSTFFKHLLGVYPFLEYAITENVDFRTVFGYFNYLYLDEEGGQNRSWIRDVHYQSVGIGVTVNRDLWIYPNFQLTPEALSFASTNVGITAQSNL